MTNKFINGDCLEGIKQYPDKYFDLAIVDPPYGDPGKEKANRFGGQFAAYKKENIVQRTGRTWSKKYGKEINDWDVAPPPEYFDELFRVSKYCIIWGGNYFDLPPQRNFIIWQKSNIPEDFLMAMVEYAWTNIPGNAKLFYHKSLRDKTSGGFHPTEKPIALYKWLLTRYAKPGDKILDTHVGSASSLIACEELGFEYVGFELDPVYYEKAKQRLDEFNAQIRFDI